MSYGPDTVSDFQLRTLFVWFTLTFFVMAGVLVLTAMFIYKDINVHPTMAELDSYAIIMSPDSVSYHDQGIDRVYILEIDLSQAFAQNEMKEKLKAAFNMAEFGLMYAQIRFLDLDQNVMKYNGKEIAPVYINEERYKESIEIINAYGENTEGKGSYTYKQRKFFARFRDQGRIVPGIMEATIIIPNT